MSKNAIWPAAQNPLAAPLNPASSDLLPALYSNCSPVSFCIVGLIWTSRHTSYSRLAVMFLSLVWRNVKKPPFLHVKACSMFKLFPHVHPLDVRDNGYPYMILTRSQNSCFLSIYPSSSIGRVDSHVEPPCSVLISFSLHS